MCIRQRIGGSNPPLTAIFEKELVRKYGLFFRILHICGGMRNPRPGVDYWRSQLDRPGASRTGCPKGASKASQSPPHRHIRERARTQVRAFFSHIAHLRGDEKPPTGGRLLAQPVGQTGSIANGLPQRGEQSESIPPSPPYSRKSSYASTGFFFACCICRMRCKHLIRPTFLHLVVGLISNAPSGMAVIVG